MLRHRLRHALLVLFLLWAFLFTQAIHDFILIVNIPSIFQRDCESLPPLSRRHSLPRADTVTSLPALPLSRSTFYALLGPRCISVFAFASSSPFLGRGIILPALFCNSIFFFNLLYLRGLPARVSATLPGPCAWLSHSIL